ncbi:mitochondrial metalloendopeptidase OMA1 [Beta vulgaris subsp. vulgaris]|uniref:mitochondrial metalloendopeptidase OMA1 n=1 Tax=Beta vulgaris subsp. vulgaris TaxID=3555 RepID=UPI00203710F7|nr:mitochondrial metalloendopeptidase OMA1 [Beta vulgaris subsp. vulgaris]
MAFHRNSRFVYNALKPSFNSKLLTKTSSHSNSYSLFYTQFKFFRLHGSPSISSKCGYFNRFKHNQNRIISGVATIRNSLEVKKTQNFFGKQLKKKNSWWGDGILFVMTIYYSISEVVPFTERKHLVIPLTSLEIKIGEFMKKKLYDGKILPATHRASVRARVVFEHIIVSLDHKLIHEGHGSKTTTKHLKVFVVDEPRVFSFCFPGGMIAISTGLLNYFHSDSELAAIIGTQVADAVARPCAELFPKYMLAMFVISIINPSARIVKIIQARACKLRPFTAGLIKSGLNFTGLLLCFAPLDCYFLWRKMEADYIGLQLMSSAGYDPRVAPQAYQKLRRQTIA